MKKLYLLIPIILSLAITFPTFADDVEEVVVVGTRPGGSAGGSGRGGTPVGPRKNVNVADNGGGVDAYKTRQACLANAEDVGKKCDEAYATLQPVCSALTGYFGARLGTLFWERALGTTIDAKAVEAMKSGGALSGYTKDDAMINCTWLTSQAKAYCASGVEKLKAKC